MGGVGEEEIPIIDADDHAVRPVADICRDRVLRVDVPQHPAAAVVVDEDGPAGSGLRARGREAADHDIGAGARGALDGEVLGGADGEEGAAAGDQDSGGAGGGDGLQVHLLLVDDVGVVEGGVVGVDFSGDGGVEGVWWLRHDCVLWWIGRR